MKETARNLHIKLYIRKKKTLEIKLIKIKMLPFTQIINREKISEFFELFNPVINKFQQNKKKKTFSF